MKFYEEHTRSLMNFLRNFTVEGAASIRGSSSATLMSFLCDKLKPKFSSQSIYPSISLACLPMEPPQPEGWTGELGAEMFCRQDRLDAASTRGPHT